MDVCFIDIESDVSATAIPVHTVRGTVAQSQLVCAGRLSWAVCGMDSNPNARTQDAVQRTAGQVAIQRLFEPEPQLFQRPIVAGQAVVDRLAFHDNAYELPDLLEAKKGRRPPV